MSGRGKGGKARAKSKSRSERARLQFPVGRVRRHLKRGNYAERVGAGAPVYLAAVMEYLAAEILELAGNSARDNKKLRINPRHFQLAVRNDEELNRLLAGVTIPTSCPTSSLCFMCAQCSCVRTVRVCAMFMCVHCSCVRNVRLCALFLCAQCSCACTVRVRALFLCMHCSCARTLLVHALFVCAHSA